MALTGLQIQKLLPKTNCKECGANTCLAFAMKLASQKAELSECPYASEEAIAVLGAASEPPVKTVNIGERKMGAETVLYRHEKTFVNETLISININDNDADAKTVLEKVRDYKLERVGEILTVSAICVTQKDGGAKFVDAVKAAKEITGLPVILNSCNLADIKDAAAILKGTNSLIANVCPACVDDCKAIATENGMAMAICADSMDELFNLSAKLREEGFKSIVLQFNAKSILEAFTLNTVARRAALTTIKEMGYPTLAIVEGTDVNDVLIKASNEVNKYGGIVVLPMFNEALLVTLMTLRLNIYTDPQKPIQVEPMVYAIGEPDENSPVFVTTNFSLTYFLVSGEIENTGISAHLIIPECEGFSVLTAWSAGKFSGSHIAKFVKEMGLDDTQKNKTIIIPGYVSQISGEVEEGLPGWKVMVGPQEAGDIESFVKLMLK